MVGSMNSQVETIRNETMRLGTDLTESNKERYNQITELMNSLRIALERKDTMENSYKTQINKLVSTLKLVSEEKTEIEGTDIYIMLYFSWYFSPFIKIMKYR